MQYICFIYFIFFFFFTNAKVVLKENTLLLDKIIYKIGDEIISHAAVEEAYQASQNNDQLSNKGKKEFLEQIIDQKILLAEAKKSNLTVTKKEVDENVQMRLDHMLAQAGSEEELTGYFKKSLKEIRENMQKNLQEDMLISKMKEKIIADITIRPKEVSSYYQSLLPSKRNNIPMQIQYIVYQTYYPGSAEKYRNYAYKILQDIKEKILAGKKFEEIVQKYSLDYPYFKQYPETWHWKFGDLDQDYERVIRTLSPGEISHVLENTEGFYLIQLIERKNNRFRCRHIFMPHKGICSTDDNIKKLYTLHKKFLNKKMSTKIDGKKKLSDKTSEKKKKRNKIAKEKKLDIISKFSYKKSIDDKEICNTLVFNEKNESILLKDMLIKMEEGDITKPVIVENGKKKYVQIIYLEKKIPSHSLNFNDDYSVIYQKALERKKKHAIQKFIQTVKNAYLSR